VQAAVAAHREAADLYADPSKANDPFKAADHRARAEELLGHLPEAQRTEAR
jgi:hypothetical protein